METYTTATELLASLGSHPDGAWAATDADGTLWAADVAEEAWNLLVASRLMGPAAGPAMARILRDVERPTSGDVHADAERVWSLFTQGVVGDVPILRAMTFCFAGWTEDEVRELGAQVARDGVVPRAYATTREVLLGLQAQGLKLVVVSGSPRILVEEALRALDIGPIPPVLGTDLEVEGGVLTDRLTQPITWFGGKVDALAPLLGGAPLHVAFGDTSGDQQLLEAAAVRVMVHPRPSLRAVAGTDGSWRLFEPPGSET